MSVRQFTNSLGIIRRAEESNRGAALLRHLAWQGRKLLFPQPVTRRISNSVITDDEPGGVISMVNMLGRYDFNNMHFVQSLLSQASAPVFLDVGANIGAYTLIASEIAAAKVVSFEPIPAAFAKLQRNVQLNARDRVTLLPVAVGAETGQLRMTCNGASAMNRVVAAADEAPNTIMVPVETLDEVCRRLQIVPTLIKIDVEGHEPSVLAGATASLRECAACIAEDGDRPSVIALMHANSLRGPYHYIHRTRTLQPQPQRLPEDHIFISPHFSAAYPSITIERA